MVIFKITTLLLLEVCLLCFVCFSTVAEDLVEASVEFATDHNALTTSGVQL